MAPPRPSPALHLPPSQPPAPAARGKVPPASPESALCPAVPKAVRSGRHPARVCPRSSSPERGGLGASLSREVAQL